MALTSCRGWLRASRLRIKAGLHAILFAVLNACVVSPLLLSRNGLLRFFLFEAIFRSRYQGPLISGDGRALFVHDSRDRGPGRELFIHGTQDFAKFETACGLLRDNGFQPIATLVDVGANIGTICIPAVKSGLARRAIAVEAVPDIVRLLHTNIALNDLTSSIDVVAAAAGANSGDMIDIAVNRTNQGDNRIAGSSRGAPDADQFARVVQVATTTLDDLLKDATDATLIWMDIQGYEGIALGGARRTLTRTPPIVLEFCPFLMTHSGSYDMLKAAVAHYRGFYDLGQPSALRSVASLDALHASLGQTGNFTDILLL
jgi:FkbM family methyltransferase